MFHLLASSCNSNLSVPVVVRDTVDKVEVERSARLLDVDRQAVERLRALRDGVQLPLQEVHRQNLVLVTPLNSIRTRPLKCMNTEYLNTKSRFRDLLLHESQI